MKETPSYPKAILGIDVSKKKLDLCLIPDESIVSNKHGQRSMSQPKSYRRTVTNTIAGMTTIAKWLMSKGVTTAHVSIEPTSVYHEFAVETLLSGGHWVSIVNAGQVRQYAAAMGIDTKTDTIDALVLAEFCRARRPAASKPLNEAERQLRDLTRRRTVLVREEQKELLRLQTTRSKSCIASIKRMIKAIVKERSKIKMEIEGIIEDNEELRTIGKNYQSIKGVGAVTSATVMAELPDLSNFASARQAVAFVGLAPRRKQSGSSINRYGGITKRGNSRVREALFMSAMVGMKYDPVLNAFAQRLREANKKKKVVIVAVMRKIMHLLYGIAKSGHPRRLPSSL